MYVLLFVWMRLNLQLCANFKLQGQLQNVLLSLSTAEKSTAKEEKIPNLSLVCCTFRRFIKQTVDYNLLPTVFV